MTSSSLSKNGGHWHGRHCYFGFHHDLHAAENDTAIGTRCEVDDLVAMLKLAGVEFAQTDSKGHPGYTTWRSKTPGASVAAGMTGHPPAWDPAACPLFRHLGFRSRGQASRMASADG